MTTIQKLVPADKDFRRSITVLLESESKSVIKMIKINKQALLSAVNSPKIDFYMIKGYANFDVDGQKVEMKPGILLSVDAGQGYSARFLKNSLIVEVVQK